MYRILKTYLKPRFPYVVATVLFTALEYVLQIFFLLPQSKDIINNGVLNKDYSAIMNSALVMLGLTLAVGVCSVVTAYTSAKATAGFVSGLRRDCFFKGEQLSPQDFAALGESTIITRTTADVTQLQIMVINLLRLWLMVPILIIVELAMIARLNLTVFFILAVVFAAVVLFLVTFSAKSLGDFSELQKKVDRINLLMKERILGVRPIRAFRNEKLENDKSIQAHKESHDMAVRANARINFLSPIALVLMSWVVVLIYLVGNAQIQAKMTSISDLILIFQYITYFITSLMIIPFVVNTLPKASVSARRVNELLNYEPAQAVEWRNTPAPAVKNGKITFKNVIFGYAGAMDVIADVSFVAEPGRTTALIGPTGSGKTTILNLMQGLYQPTFGDILIDDVSIHACKDSWIRDYFSYGTQRPMIFQDTVKNNICPDKDHFDEARFKMALEGSCFSEVLKDKPEGVDFMMSQGGMNISGGQRQRLSLARTMAKDAPVYVFDDTLSALDARTEKKVLDAIRTQLAGKTIVLVAQKISTIQDADHIIVMDRGRVAGQGRHEDLLKTCDVYKDIYETQCYLEQEGE